jgi:hypothetical protein
MKFILSILLIASATVAFAGVSISTPGNNSSVTSPAQIVADASSTNPIVAIVVYVDGTGVFNLRNQTHLNTYLWLTTGQHGVTVAAWDSAGKVMSSTVKVYATSLRAMTKIEEQPGWQWCTQKLNGSVCAAGAGEAVSWMSRFQTTPSLDGSSSEFYIGGATGYSNALWWKSLGGGSKLTHFRYDVYVYVTEPNLPQSLEFDLNQSFGGHRWVFGTQCDFKDTGRWELWDSVSNRWRPTWLPCKPFAANRWTHIVWSFERIGTKVHYISLQLNGSTIPLNIYWGYQSSYPNSDINIAFQMDGDYRQDPYHVWLDKLTVAAW